jgi:hypothetical protein
MNITDTYYKGFGKCLELSNNNADLVITLDCGPRIIRYGFKGQQNEFCDDAGLFLDVHGEPWKLMGGHRLWHSPEAYPRTYVPDNKKVEWERKVNAVCVAFRDRAWVQVDREMEITLSDNDSTVRIEHNIINKNAWPVELAAWALTVMAPGGVEIIPQPRLEGDFHDRTKGLRVITLWPYARMNDPRVFWGERYITVRQDINNENHLKFGLSNEEGWAAYLNRNHLFVKKYTHDTATTYPDRGVSFETFCCSYMLEMETLSPLIRLEPDASLIHTEEWRLFENVQESAEQEEIIDGIVKKYINPSDAQDSL